ncbi:MAG: response regulator [Treponema sp.]|jgi:two-component system response regulator YesN|nr:response regulator [Treponema sp.]
MYRVLFVDDEPWVIIDILHSIPWGKLGFEVIGHYDKPREAKEAILAQKPHLVFVDINMPVMNGFELIRACREGGCDSAFVILSAYSDFEFAKQAIKAAVLDYCLKPVNPVSMIAVLDDIRKQLDERESVKKAEEAAEQEILGVPAVSNERFDQILKYVTSNFNTKLLLQEIADEFGFSKNYICFLFKKYTGHTFSNYVTAMRIEKSKELLKTTKLPLYVIAENTGFMDYYYFSRVFKSVCGMPPHKYRVMAHSAVKDQALPDET